ncbi:MAG: hypothetical protein AAGU12_12360 [Clostridiales bacterium]
MQKNQREALQNEIIRAIGRLDFFNLQKLGAFIAGLETARAEGKESPEEREEANHDG